MNEEKKQKTVRWIDILLILIVIGVLVSMLWMGSQMSACNVALGIIKQSGEVGQVCMLCDTLRDVGVIVEG